MTSTTRTLFAATIAAACLLQPTAPAAAQVSSSPPVVSQTAQTNEQADQLHARAESLFTMPPRYPEAARLLVRAARMRSPTDEMAVRELAQAARLYAYAKHPRAARSTMEMAAQRALGIGDVARAAHIYLDAAHLAAAQGDAAGVRALATKAEQLASLRTVAAADRTRILERIVPVRVALGTTR